MNKLFKKFSVLLCMLPLISSCGNNSETTSLSEKNEEMNLINYIGRYQIEIVNEKEIATFAYSCSGFEIRIDVKNNDYQFGINLFNKLTNQNYQFINLYVDDVLNSKIKLTNKYEIVNIKDLGIGKHTIRINKLNEVQFSKIGLVGYDLKNVEIINIEKSKKRKMEVYGDSISCGYGNLASSNKESFSMDTEDAMQAYGQLCAEELGFDCNTISYSGLAMALSPFNNDYNLLTIYDTSDGVGKWDFANYIPEYVVINIGTNDNTAFNSSQSKDKPAKLKLFKNNYLELMEKLKNAYKEVKFVCVSNMMVSISKDLIDGILESINSINEKYGSCAYYYAFDTDNKGADGHPGLSAHKNNAALLADFITSLDDFI